MKLTKAALKQLIQEELQQVLHEIPMGPPPVDTPEQARERWLRGQARADAIHARRRPHVITPELHGVTPEQEEVLSDIEKLNILGSTETMGDRRYVYYPPAPESELEESLQRIVQEELQAVFAETLSAEKQAKLDKLKKKKKRKALNTSE